MNPCLADGPYRYLLTRDTGLLSSGRVLFVMLNPSVADASQDDPTIRRCVGFASSWGYRHLDVVNLFAWRATDPADLEAQAAAGVDVVGPGNDSIIGAAIERADRVVAAWGWRAPRGRAADVVGAILSRGKPIWCLGRCNSGDPRHPLYVRSTQPLVLFAEPHA